MYSRLKDGVLEIACPDCAAVTHGLEEVCPACQCEHFRKVSPGDGATMSSGSDRYPYTVTCVNKSGKTIQLQADDFHLISDTPYSDSQEYSYTRNTDAAVVTARWSNKRQCYQRNGHQRVSIGHRNAYWDPCF